MARSVLLLLAGAMMGAGAVYLQDSLATRDRESDPPTAAEFVPPPPPVTAAAAIPAARGYATERFAIYEQAAEAVDPFEIEVLIEGALDQPASRLREIRLTALLQRYAEIDPRGAAAFARARYLDPAHLVTIFEVWASNDADAAITELALITPPARQREIALTILDVIGNNADGVERVAAALAPADVFSFEADAMLLRAELDPAGAIRDLIAMPDYYRRTLLLTRVAEVAALVDPRAALAQAEGIDEYVIRRAFRDAVFTTWASLDPEAVYVWLETARTRDLPESTAVYQALARIEPNRLFAMLEGLPPAAQTNARRAAMQALAEIDPIAAIAQLGTLPPGPDRDNLLPTIGQAYGRQNPDLALAWARSLPAGQVQGAMRSVVQGIMSVNPDLAVDVVIAELESAGRAGPMAGSSVSLALLSLGSLSTMSSLTGNAQVDFGRIADRLLNVNNPQVGAVVPTMIGSWARQSPDEALRWALGNVDRLDGQAFARMAQAIAQTDSERALEMLNQLPAAQRPDWLSGVAEQLAQSNPDRAVELVGQYRSQPGYAVAYGAVAQAIAQTDPPRAAALLRDSPPGNSAQLSTTYLTIASQWSRSDPGAAAAWALSITDPQAQRTALSLATQSWSQRDAAGAERWLRDMSPGATRDTAAGAFVSASAQAGRFDPRVLELFSSEQAAQNAAGLAIRAVGRTNLPEARRLLDAHITDPRLRQQVEEYLDRSGGIGSTPIPPVGGIIF